MPDLSTALFREYKRDWLRAFCDLVFAARDYSRTRASGESSFGGPSARAHEALERAAVALYDLEAEWRPLAARPFALEFFRRGCWFDDEDRRQWRLGRRHPLDRPV